MRSLPGQLGDAPGEQGRAPQHRDTSQLPELHTGHKGLTALLRQRGLVLGTPC